MKVGFHKKVITPPLGTPLVGYYRERLMKGVIDDLYVRAVAFEQGEKRAVVLAADLCLLSGATCDDYRKTIAEFCGIDMDAVWICCNHTHTGPLTTPDFASDKLPSPQYMDFLRVTFRDAAAYALEDLKPAELYAAETKAEGISFVRRYRMKDGTTRTNPGALNPNTDYALGEPNESLKLLKIFRQGGDDLFIFNFGTHTDTVGGDYVSADYSGYACAAIEGAIPGTQAMFLMAPQGDVNHINVWKPNYNKVVSPRESEDIKERAAHARYMGRVIAGNLLAVCDRAVKLDSGDIRWGWQEVEIPSHQENDRLEEARRVNALYEAGRGDEICEPGMHRTELIAEARRIIKLEHGPLSYRYNVYALRLGDFVLAGLPGEPFTQIHNRISAGSPFANTMVCALVNACPGYFPTTQAFHEGGYEAKTSVYAAGADDILVNGMLELLETMK